MSFQTHKTSSEPIFLLNFCWNPRAFWPCIDSNATDKFKAQKGSKDIVKIVRVLLGLTDLKLLNGCWLYIRDRPIYRFTNIFPIFKHFTIIGYRFCNIRFTNICHHLVVVLRIAHRITIAACLRGNETTTAACTGTWFAVVSKLYLT